MSQKIELPLWQLLILCLMAGLESSVGQIQSNVIELEQELYSYKYKSNNTKKWMEYENMTDFSKFYLCIDVLQKVERIKVMYGQYTTQEPNMTFPAFQTETMPIKITFITEVLFIHTKTMNCPLHTIQFQKISNQTGSNFYITDSQKDYCVYVLTPNITSSENELFLEIKAKVCDIFLDINHDAPELEHEFITYYNEGIHEAPIMKGWPVVNNMNNEQRFLLCLDVSAKLMRYHLYGSEYNTSEPSNGLPQFETMIAALYFVTGNSTILAGFIWTLTCPMNKILLEKLNLSSYQYMIAPYYLAESIHDGCVYKLGLINKQYQEFDLPVADYITEVYIQAEICGVLVPVRNDGSAMEFEFMQKWSALVNENQPIIPHIMPPMTRRHQTKLAENIYWKAQQKYQKSVTHENGMKGSLQQKIIFFNYLKEDPVVAMVLRISFNSLLISDQIPIVYITDSVNFGCIYILYGNRLMISLEVCDIYPIQHFLPPSRNRSFKPILDNLMK